MVPNARKFGQALQGMYQDGQLSEIDREMLVCHYEVPGRTLTPRQMSQLMGWAGQSANRHYGRLARRISEKLDWAPSDKSAPRAYHVSSLVHGARPNLEFVWTLRPQLVKALELLGWVSISVVGDATNISDLDDLSFKSIVERRCYRWHKFLERNTNASRAAKQAHGYRCQACGLSFEERYGELGRDFIEAHHLIPLSALEFDERRSYSSDDFTVLCSNCHRMIHRWPNPSDLSGFRKMIQARVAQQTRSSVPARVSGHALR